MSPAAGEPAQESAAAARLRPRPGADADVEVELWQGGYSGKAMIGSWVGLWILSVAAILGGIFVLGGSWLAWTILAVVLLLLWLAAGAVLLYRKASVSYRLTSQRFIHQSGILFRTTDRIEMIHMDDITYTQGPIERMLGVGTIRITSSDRSHPELVVPGIADVRDVVRKMEAARRQERNRRGLHIESI